MSPVAVAVLVLEAAFTVLIAVGVIRGARVYRRERAEGRGRAAAAETAVRAELPYPLAGFAVHEVRVLQSLGLWCLRRVHGVPAGAVALPYHRADRATSYAFCGVALAEVVAVELVVPWPTVRLVLRVLGLYGLVLVFALTVDGAVRPHVVGADAIRLRFGTWIDVTVPATAVVDVQRRFRAAGDERRLADGVLTLAVAGATQVELTLDPPQHLTVGRSSGPVSVVRFAADDADAAVDAVRRLTRTA